MADPLQILLSTWNGEAFLQALLDSLLSQTHREWHLLVRDDGSSDNTQTILECFRQTHPERVTQIEGGERLGPSLSFSALLQAADADHIMLCDQDDVWLPDKSHVTMEAMERLEAEHGTNTPLLVHTDLEVVDAQLNRLSPSMRAYQHLDPDTAKQFNRQLVMNSVTGCTVMINRALAALARPIPTEAVMHDWWLALIAAAFGHSKYIEEPTIQYRQHGDNTTGGVKFGPAFMAGRLEEWMCGNAPDTLEQAQSQAKAFLARFKDRLSPKDAEMVCAYASLYEEGWFSRRLLLARHGLWKTGWIRNLGLLLRI